MATSKFEGTPFRGATAVAIVLAAGFRGDDAFQAGVSEEQALDTVLPGLSDERLMELAGEALDLYCWDRLGSDN